PGAAPPRVRAKDSGRRDRVRLEGARATGPRAREANSRQGGDCGRDRRRERALSDEGGRTAVGDELGGRQAGPLPLLGAAMRPAPAAALLFALAAAALLARHTASVAVLAAVLLVVCLR